jgi:hypothetical protein
VLPGNAVLVRTMYTLYWMVIAAGLALYIVVGLTVE